MITEPAFRIEAEDVPALMAVIERLSRLAHTPASVVLAPAPVNGFASDALPRTQ